MSFMPSTILRDIHVALKHILNTLNRPLWVDPTTSRVKTDTAITGGTLPTVTTVSTVTGVTTVTTVTTVATVTTAGTLNNLGVANVTGQDIGRLAWAQTIRARIT